MDRSNARLESLKLVKEWSVWLITLQTAICTFLWNVLKEQRIKGMSLSGMSLHLGWLAFSLSVIIATLPVPYSSSHHLEKTIRFRSGRI